MMRGTCFALVLFTAYIFLSGTCSEYCSYHTRTSSFLCIYLFLCSVINLNVILTCNATYGGSLILFVLQYEQLNEPPKHHMHPILETYKQQWQNIVSTYNLRILDRAHSFYSAVLWYNVVTIFVKIWFQNVAEMCMEYDKITTSVL